MKTSAQSERLAKRIIACLDVDAGRVVKGVQFQQLRDAGDPAELARLHAEAGADEIVMLDITATAQGRNTLIDTVRRTARQLFIPFMVGGGIRTLQDAANIFEAGADKISINSAALANPDLIEEIANHFGSQAVIVAVDAKRGTRQVATQKLDGAQPPGSPLCAGFAHNGVEAPSAATKESLQPDNILNDSRAIEPEDAEVWIAGGRKPTGRKALQWVREAEQRGAGEILLTSMDRDGTGAGFDCELTAAVAATVSIPVIASGGAGNIEHFVEVFTRGKADAALAASIFHFGIHDIAELKQTLLSAGIPMRWPC